MTASYCTLTRARVPPHGGGSCVVDLTNRSKRLCWRWLIATNSSSWYNGTQSIYPIKLVDALPKDYNGAYRGAFATTCYHDEKPRLDLQECLLPVRLVLMALLSKASCIQSKGTRRSMVKTSFLKLTHLPVTLRYPGYR